MNVRAEFYVEVKKRITLHKKQKMFLRKKEHKSTNERITKNIYKMSFLRDVVKSRDAVALILVRLFLFSSNFSPALSSLQLLGHTFTFFFYSATQAPQDSGAHTCRVFGVFHILDVYQPKKTAAAFLFASRTQYPVRKERW